MPRVSVIIPCYNDGQYLEGAIASARSQTYRDIEIIVVNDGSNDPATLKILADIEGGNVKVLHKTNGHLSSARNHGIRHASGDIIVTLDADDRFDNTFVEKGVSVLDGDVATGAVTCYLKSFGLKKFRWKPLGGNVINFLYRQESCASAMFRKECWDKCGGYDEEMKSGYEDWDFWIRLTAAGWRVHVLKEYLLNYQIRENSMLLTQSEPRREEIVNYILEKHKSLYWQHLKAAVLQRKIIDLRNPESTVLLWKNLYWKLWRKK